MLFEQDSEYIVIADYGLRCLLFLFRRSDALFNVSHVALSSFIGLWKMLVNSFEGQMRPGGKISGADSFDPCCLRRETCTGMEVSNDLLGRGQFIDVVDCVFAAFG